MGRLKIVHKHKQKRNRPITRIGRKQYRKRRFAHIRKVDNAAKENPMTAEYCKRSHTATQSYLRLGLAIDPCTPENVLAMQKKNVEKPSKRLRKGEKGLQVPTAQLGKIGQDVSEREGTMIANLILKYGNTDYMKMQFDRKLNPNQLTAKQLEKKVLNYLKWEMAALEGTKVYEDAKKSGIDLAETLVPSQKGAPTRSAEHRRKAAKKAKI